MRIRPRGVLQVLLVALLLPAAPYLAPGMLGQDGAFIVLTGSMAPTLEPGDVIFVRQVPVKDLAEGDVLTFRLGPQGALVTHRVVEVLEEGSRFRTQGDANEDPDPWTVTAEQVVGRYSFHLPAWGLFVQALRHKVGYVFLVLLPTSTILATEFVKLYRELDALDRARREKKARKEEGA